MNVTACALFEERKGPESFYGPREQVFYAGFEETWRAVNLVLQPYPLRVSNMDQGVLETDNIRGFRIWGPPHKGDVATNGETYRLTVRVVRGALERRAATKVIIVKDAQLARDFFSDPKAMPSDGLEEKTVLYRIGREIQIERALARAQKKQNQKTE
ncbi:MAG TPA: hypothetical protein PKC28_05460 [Bdellovibrionales bacterium]|nr:hypothetical protein [Bdellovibrionales bacterium]